MKKTYLKPETLVVALKVRSNMLDSSPVDPVQQSLPGSETPEEEFTPKGREVVRTPDIWEEW